MACSGNRRVIAVPELVPAFMRLPFLWKAFEIFKERKNASG